jgi:hypothetical protein
MVDRAAPTRNEHIAGYVTTGGQLYIQRWNGTVWSAEWGPVAVGGNGLDGRRFDIAYENTSGDAIVVYSNNTTGTNELRYRIWNGAAWTAATNLDSALFTTTTPNAIKLAARTTTGSDEIAATIADSANVLTTLIWNGVAWGNEPTASHGTLAGTAGQNDLFDQAYESASGDLLVIFTTSTPQQNHRTYSAGVWGTVTSWGTSRAAPLQMVAAPNHDPASNQILCLFNRSASANVYAKVWDGAAIGATTGIGGTGATTAIEQRTINGGWLRSGTSTAAVAFWGSATASVIDYNYTSNGGTSWAGATTYAITMGNRRWFDVDEDPQATDTLMLTVSDSANDLFARQLTWNGTALAWTAPTNGTITAALGSLTTQNFDFTYDRYSPPAATLTIGNGTNPGDNAVCPGGAATMLDAFTLQTSAGTDTVSAVTVTLAAGTSAGLSLIEITDDAGTNPPLGSLANPGTDTPSISLTTNITATTTLTQYKVRVTPRTHANMPVPPGTTYTVTGTVTGVTNTLTDVFSDSASSVVTIDNAAPPDATWGTVTPGNGQVVLNWTNPATDFGQVVVLRNTATIGDTPVEGASYTAPGTLGTSAIVYVGTLQTLTDSSVTNGTAYYYKIFVRDACGNYSAGAQTGPHTPSAPVLPVTPGVPSASIDACNQITVSTPFTGDTNANSSTVTSRGASATGPWTAVCSKTGASPRPCVDIGVLASSTYYYQVDFTDPDGVVGTDPRVIGPFSTPSCGVPATTAGTVSATVSSCRQITVTAPFTGDFDGDGSIRVEYNTTSTWPGTVACSAVTGPSPRQCLVTGLSPSTSYYVRTTFSDVDGVTGTNPQVLGPFALGACAADQVAPMALVLAPMREAVLGGTDRVKVQVWDEGALAASNPVLFSIDSGAFSATGVTANANYNCGTGCKVYELNLDTTLLANGAHSFSVKVTDTAGNVGQTAWAFRVNNDTTSLTPKGAGTLLRRTTGSQLCVDCHAIATHSSQETSSKYGNWAIDCLTCHTPHKTGNIYLVRPSIQTPRSGTNAIDFRYSDRAGGTNPEYGHLGTTATNNYTDGVCETCHTQTNHYRNDTSGGDHTHNSPTRCTACHAHAAGFAAGESSGGYRCSDCHPAIWQGMTGAVAKTSKHTIGAVVGTNDSFTDANVTFGNPLSATLASERKCLSCHQDHIHNNPGAATHDYSVHTDATSQATRAVTRDGAGNITVGTPARTDYDGVATNGGMCLSCHRNPIDATHPAVDKAAYDISAHDYVTFSTYGTWQFALHDGSTFGRNCTKCHADRADSGPSDSTTPFGAVHFSDYGSLLGGTTNPAGAPATFVCYNCHGSATTGANLSGKSLDADFSKAAKHPVNADALHNTANETTVAYATTGNVFKTSRHVNCIDCHEPHKARNLIHDYAATATSARNLLAATSPLLGVSGVQLNFAVAPLTTSWSVPTTASYTWIPASTGSTLEYQICFKCHTSFAWGTGTPPNGISANGTVTTPVETDVAQEFNPNNASGHPVVTGLNNYGAASIAPKQLLATQMKAPWATNLGTQTMMCSDCHNTDSASPAAQGPHGSAVQFMLRGANAANWPNVTLANIATSWCANCHVGGRTGNNVHNDANHNATLICYQCHIVIPHGGKLGRLIGDRDTMPARYAYNNTLTNMQITGFTKANRTYQTSNCGAACDTGTHPATNGAQW